MTRPDTARKVSIFRNNRNQAIRLPKDFEFQGVTELTIERQGDTIVLRPVRPDWRSFMEEPPSDTDFLVERPDVIEEGRFSLDDDGETNRREALRTRQEKK
ncbi:AbrB/MazE/SpoVT family DNA-binding domain-containing protein [Stappia sp. F7233]|uniref:AbrB/MazE/SpoVT family DNA-binding domain-containing protein n=1 Tax=Stappia albiluteola TaxID=2758565 RepID=A0A839ADD6_9HYPH|nr:type II toxin-antitoxin system VapB family antitoxin [Stappia albiluteola]MBA5776847.1 AbrB/MazE/SpoVT family DNA-binding domain-containing protein [Stappia albiluteola]